MYVTAGVLTCRLYIGHNHSFCHCEDNQYTSHNVLWAYLHAWVWAYNGRCIIILLWASWGVCGYAWYNYMHEKFTLPTENLVDAWCIHEWGNGRSERRWWEYDLPVLGTLLRSFGLYFSCWHWWYLYRVLLINFHCMHACVYVTSAQLESIYLQTRHVSSSRPTKLWLISMCVDNVWQSIHHSAHAILAYFTPHAAAT